MDALVNVLLGHPTEPLEYWQEEAERWIALNKALGGNPEFFPLTIKAAYVSGVIYYICRSVSILLKDQNTFVITYFPAYGLFGSSVDLLGRCIKGNRGLHGVSEDIETGFKWLSRPGINLYESVRPNHIVLTTSANEYTIERLVALRHFAAHGQATSKDPPQSLDYELLEKVLPLLASGLEVYWAELQQSEELCNRLAKANIVAFRSDILFNFWWHFFRSGLSQYPTIKEIFGKLDWHVSRQVIVSDGSIESDLGEWLAQHGFTERI